MGSLKTEHEELKTMFKAFKNTRETLIVDEHNLKNNAEGTKEAKDLYTPNIDVKHKIILKKPARLLPLSLFQKYKFTRSCKSSIKNCPVILEIFHFQAS